MVGSVVDVGPVLSEYNILVRGVRGLAKSALTWLNALRCFSRLMSFEIAVGLVELEDGSALDRRNCKRYC